MITKAGLMNTLTTAGLIAHANKWEYEREFKFTVDELMVYLRNNGIEVGK